MLVHVVWLVGALLLLALGAELLVRGASALARRLGLSPFAIGLTVVGFGTSSPELFASITAGLGGQGDIAVGNVVGSNTFNVGCILGLTALLIPIPVPRAMVRGEAVPLLAAAVLPFAALLFAGVLPRWLGVAMVAGLVAYLVRAYRAGRAAAQEPQVEAQREHELGLDQPAPREHPWLSSLLAVAGLVLLVVGADWLVEHAAAIARDVGVSELAIGLTIVAMGTSAPELVTSLVAALRRRPEIAVGNVVGSNVFNVLGVLGATTALTPQRVADDVLRRDAPVMLAFTCALLAASFTRQRIGRLEGALLLGAVVAYTVVLLGG